MLKRKLFKLTRKTLDPHASGKWCINIGSLAGNAFALVAFFDVMQSPHIMQTVSQFDQQYPHIFRQSQNELLQILSLLGSIGI